MAIWWLMVFWLSLLSINGHTQDNFSTFQHPFTADSPWNSRPISPAFSNFIIPTSTYFPSIGGGIYSSGCFYADQNDNKMIIKTAPGLSGIHDRDAEQVFSKITIPHWPANLIPASGSDGHADIFDMENGVIHSFWRLKLVNGEWTSQLYSWSPINGTGWGDPAHYYQGGRAVGIPACAGIIRTFEVDDGDTMFRHALALSLTYNALSKDPPYVYPATSSDSTLSSNTGEIPQGALLMLPDDFDLSRITTPLLRKIANTLKEYGAYVVDRNVGTPFLIYAEIGANVGVHQNGWNVQAGNELQLLRRSLRMVESVQGWLDGEQNSYTPNLNLNLLSMRGPWSRGVYYVADSAACSSTCDVMGKFDSLSNKLIFGATNEPVIQSNSSSRSINIISWAKPNRGERFLLTSHATGGAKFRLLLKDRKRNDFIVFDSKDLEESQSIEFTWPLDDVDVTIVATSGVGEGSTVSATLIRAQ